MIQFSRIPILGGLFDKFGIRSKLIIIFVVIKIIPLLGLAWIALKGAHQLGHDLLTRTEDHSNAVQKSIVDLGQMLTNDSIRALDDRSRESIERLTTDTAFAVSNFLYDRDKDIRYAATLPRTPAAFTAFLKNYTRPLTDQGQWQLSADQKKWEPAEAFPNNDHLKVIVNNPENKQNFSTRPPEYFGKMVEKPLFLEMTFFDPSGQEQIKITTSDLLDKNLRNISNSQNTFCKAEKYFQEARKLKAGEIYVSDVIGAYVGSNIIGPYTPLKAKEKKIAFEPEKAGYAGRENPVGKKFRGIIRWVTPVTQNGSIVGYISLALDHAHIMNFVEHLMPTDARYAPIADAAQGNYAFIWDYKGRSIAHPRHHSIMGYDPETGKPVTPWLDKELYAAWKQSGTEINTFLAKQPIFDHQSRNKKPSPDLTKNGLVGLDCRYLNFAPQCTGWHNLTENGGSGSFIILWSGVWKLTTAATIPYYTGQYSTTPRGFGYVTIGANVDDFHRPALASQKKISAQINKNQEELLIAQHKTRQMIDDRLTDTARNLFISTVLMIAAVIFIAILMANSLTKRITDLIKGLKRFENGDLNYRLEQTSQDEMGQLIHSFNKMADKVSESFVRIEEAKEKAEEANRIKTNFIASISHEFRTPLNGILGFAEILKDELEDEMQKECAETIQLNAEQLIQLVTSVLDMAKIEAGQMNIVYAEIEIRNLITQVVQVHLSAIEDKNLELGINIAGNVPRLFRSDPTRLTQIFNILLSNAVKFTEQGTIQIQVEPDKDQEGFVRFCVRDTGCGIPEELQTVVFEKFRQIRQVGNFSERKHGGTGLGLALAKQIVNLLDGEITFSSTVGEGSTFCFVVPHKTRN